LGHKKTIDIMSGLIAGIVGTAVSVTTASVSFAQAAKQKQAKKRAEDEADSAIARARTALDVNYYEELAIAKEPFELQREASLAAGAQAIEAGREGDARGVGAVAGRVQMAQEQAQAQTRASMSQEMQRLEELTAQEDSRLRDIGIQLDLEEVAGAQMAARDASQARQVAIQQGMEGVTSAASQAASTIPLYGKTQDTRQFNKMKRQWGGENQETLKGMTADQKNKAFQEHISATSFTPEQYTQFGNVYDPQNPNTVTSGPASKGVQDIKVDRNWDFGAVGAMSNSEFNDWMTRLTPQQRAMLYTKQR